MRCELSPINQYLTNIDVEVGNLYYNSEDGVLYDYEKTTLLRYPAGKTTTSLVISESVESIGEYALSFNKNITNLLIGKNVLSIGKNALYEMTSLQELTIPFIGETVSTNKFIGFIFGANNYVANNSYVPESLKTVIVTNDT